MPGHDVHAAFQQWAETRLTEPVHRALFKRMARRSGIDHRWSVLPAGNFGGSPTEPGGFYAGDWPGTAQRMQVYGEQAPALAEQAIAALRERVSLDGVTHIVVASCTGFVAPGIDQILAARLGLKPTVERLLVGYMGCYAAVVALRSARHIVRSDPNARVLVVCVELTTLHLQNDAAIEPILGMMQFGDGAAAALVSADATGLALDTPFSATLPGSADLIQWDIGDHGFIMHLSGGVPGAIGSAMSDHDARASLFPVPVEQISNWAVHAGGRSILDAVETALKLPDDALRHSRDILSAYGNMSSATLMFVLSRLLDAPPEGQGAAIAFGPGLAAEGFLFRAAA